MKLKPLKHKHWDVTLYTRTDVLGVVKVSSGVPVDEEEAISLACRRVKKPIRGKYGNSIGLGEIKFKVAPREKGTYTSWRSGPK